MSVVQWSMLFAKHSETCNFKELLSIFTYILTIMPIFLWLKNEPIFHDGFTLNICERKMLSKAV